MGNNMYAILVTTNLQGSIAGPVSHRTTQSHSVDVGKGNSKLIISKDIRHTDRGELECCRKTHISDEVVSSWMKGGCPDWSDVKRWKNYSLTKRVALYVARFDEGYGVSYEVIE